MHCQREGNDAITTLCIHCVSVELLAIARSRKVCRSDIKAVAAVARLVGAEICRVVIRSGTLTDGNGIAFVSTIASLLHHLEWRAYLRVCRNGVISIDLVWQLRIVNSYRYVGSVIGRNGQHQREETVTFINIVVFTIAEKFFTAARRRHVCFCDCETITTIRSLLLAYYG